MATNRNGMIEVEIHFPGSSGLGHGLVWMPCCPRIGEHLATNKRGQDLLFVVVDVIHGITVDDRSLGHSGGISPIVTLADVPFGDDDGEAELNR